MQQQAEKEFSVTHMETKDIQIQAKIALTLVILLVGGDY